jgi:hypothetical protein
MLAGAYGDGGAVRGRSSLAGSARLFQPVYFGVRLFLLHRIERLREKFIDAWKSPLWIFSRKRTRSLNHSVSKNISTN